MPTSFLLPLLSCTLAAAPVSDLAAQTAAPPAALRFTENLGQDGDAALYSTRIHAVHVLFEPGAMVVHGAATAPIHGPGVKVAGAPERPLPPTRPEVDVRFAFADAGPARLVAHDQLPGIENVYVGRDPARWRSGLRAWASLSYEGLWPGIALDLHERDGTLHYDVVVEPGADLGAFGLRVDGFGLSVEPDGSLRVETPRGALRQTIPAAWEEAGAQRLPVSARFELRADGTVGIAAPERDASRRLVVDPGLDVFAGFGAGLLDEEFYALTVQPVSGLQVAAGYVGADALVRSSDVVTGFFVFSTLFDGLGGDAIVGVTCNEIGDIYISGITDSLALPTTPGAFLVFAPGAGDAFVAHLNPIGFLLQLSYVGGVGGTEASNTAIDVGPTGDVFLAGYTESPGFPVVPAGLVVGPFYGGAGDTYVMQLDPTLTFDLASTYLGGAFADYPGIGGLAVADDGTISVGGFTDSPGFPVVAAFDPIYGGATDAYLTRLFPGFLAFAFSTFQGGPDLDAFNAIGVDDEANVWGAGYTESAAGIPGIGPPAVLDVGYNGGGDVFLVKHDPAGVFLWGTYRGGSGVDTAIGLAVDRFGRAHWTGTTNSGIPPSIVPYPITPIDGVGPFVGYEGIFDEVGPDGDLESFASYVAIVSPADDQLWAIALGRDDSAYTAGSIYPAAGSITAQLERITLPWFEVTSPLFPAGFALEGTTEPQLMGDGTLVAGLPIQIRISNCVPFSVANLIIGVGPALLFPFLGGTLVPPPTFIIPGLFVGGAGEVVLPAVWPPGIPAGTGILMQAWIPDVLGPAGFAASNAIRTDPP